MHQLIDKKNKIIIYLLFLFILSTTSAKFINNQSKLSLSITKIDVLGLSNGKNLEILKNLESLLHKNIFIINKEEVKKILDKHNIIEDFNIKKIYPSSLYVEIKPTKFIARVSNKGQFVIGANGKLIKDKDNNEILPYVFGDFNSSDFLTFKNNIEKSKFFFSELKTLYFFPSRRWDILTNNDILIKLPQEPVVVSLDLAHKIIDNDNFKNNKYIDLRVKNNLITK